MENIKYTESINVVYSGEYQGNTINYDGILNGWDPDDILIEMSPETIESYTIIDTRPVFGIDMYYQERSNKLYCDVEYLIKIFWKDGKKSLIYIDREVYFYFIAKMNDPQYEP